MTRIDAHVHWDFDEPDYLDFIGELDLHLINVSVAVDDDGSWRENNAELWQDLARRHPLKTSWITSFDLPRHHDAEYAEKVINTLRDDLALGAIACKVWKNIGMEAKKPDGSWLMIDDPIFDPIFTYLASQEVPLLAHIGEPLACWQPSSVVSSHSEYYAAHPEWHFHGRSDHPSHGEIIDARDRMVERNPTLRVIGAHLGSTEYDVKEIAARLDRYPNFSVDTSARMWDLAAQNPEDVSDFFEAYRTRILWGTDTVNRDATTPIDELRERYAREFRYYETTDTFASVTGPVRGIGLRPDILERIYRENSLEWYPRL